MTINDLDGLNRLCADNGVTLEYYDIRGNRYQPEVEVKLSILAELGFPIDCDEDLHQYLQSAKTETVIDAVQICRIHEGSVRLRLRLTPLQIDGPVNWTLTRESGQQHEGSWDLNPVDATGDASQRLHFEVTLPLESEIGYHDIKLVTADGRSFQSQLIVTPDSCFQPAEFDKGRKLWGISLQLYSLRSNRNWGIGDFTDLQSVVALFAPLGVDLIGLNPLHALFPLRPEDASPYSPSSRDFVNPVYLDIEAMQDFQFNFEVQQQVRDETFQARLKKLRALDSIDYSGVWCCKLEILKALYGSFQTGQNPNANRVDEFRQYRQAGGNALYKFALFEALQEHFYRLADIIRWQDWPEEFINSESNAVAEWAQQHPREIEFYQYLQWQAGLQLAAVQYCCQQQTMAIGIYADLAVGNERSSAQCWSEASLYAMDMSIGAPPDDFNLNGQDWGLPPLLPGRLQQQAYAPFIRSLRANMRHAGALRIDHVMGLMRLLWVPRHCSPDQGSYVAYPFAELLAILALESQRLRCLIIGEDLGTVADEVRHALEQYKILSYRIFCFEKNWHHGSFNSPQAYPRNALCTAGSHDLPTLRGFWQGSDLELREQLELYPSSDIARQQRQLRAQDRGEIIAALQRENLAQGINPDGIIPDLDEQLAHSIQRFLARSNSALMMVQLEDLLLQQRQMNLPGTVDEYPNWRSKISIELERWSEHCDIEAFAEMITRERGAASD